jgi:hypothetical protein
MPHHSWIEALRSYHYPVNLQNFEDANNYHDWFNLNLSEGNREETMRFEERFRQYGRERIEVWYEVVFWKMYSQPHLRNHNTHGIIANLHDATATQLWENCQQYIQNSNWDTFDTFRQIFNLTTLAIATVATFPAFMNPEDYPMVDRQVAHWVHQHLDDHNVADPNGHQLVTPHHPNGGLTMADFDFYKSWILWCRYTAHKLSNLTRMAWRARDVEMAVFTAQRDDINLAPLPPFAAHGH